MHKPLSFYVIRSCFILKSFATDCGLSVSQICGVWWFSSCIPFLVSLSRIWRKTSRARRTGWLNSLWRKSLQLHNYDRHPSLHRQKRWTNRPIDALATPAFSIASRRLLCARHSLTSIAMTAHSVTTAAPNSSTTPRIPSTKQDFPTPSMGISGSDWLEVPTIYKAYCKGEISGDIPPKYGLKNGTNVPP